MAENETPKVTPVKSVDDSKLLAALSYLSILSIVFYVLKKEDAFIQSHAKQGMVIFVFHLVGMFLGPLALLVWPVALVLMIIGAVKAYSGEKYRIPVVADLANKINF